MTQRISVDFYLCRPGITVFTVCYSGSSLDDVSLASWWSAVEVTSVNIERRDSFAHLAPSDTYIKAWYKLKELEVALCSTCLTSCQVRESWPLGDYFENRVFVRQRQI